MTPSRRGRLSDRELLLKARRGDAPAFAELWTRHAGAARSFARAISRFDAEDVVSEAFARIIRAVNAGKGPTIGFRPYLYTVIRNLVGEWGRAGNDTVAFLDESIEDTRFSERSRLAKVDQELTLQAFRSLPERWREALWYSEVEGLDRDELAHMLGLRPNAVAQLTFRAREALRDAWVQAHLKSVEPDSEHHWTIDKLGAHARGRLARRDRDKVDRHLADCARCAVVATEADQVASRLRVVLVPILLGGIGAGTLGTLFDGGVRAPAQAGAPAPRAVGASLVVAAVAVFAMTLTAAVATLTPFRDDGAESTVSDAAVSKQVPHAPTGPVSLDSPQPSASDGPDDPRRPREEYPTDQDAALEAPAAPQAPSSVPAVPTAAAPDAGPVPDSAAAPAYRVAQQVSMPSAGSGIAVDAVRGLVYVAGRSSNEVWVYDEATLTLQATVAVPDEPYNITVGPTGFVYVSQYTGNALQGSVAVIDPTTRSVVATEPTGNSPVGVTVSADGTRLWVGNGSSQFVSVFDLADPASPAPVAPITLAGPSEIVTEGPNGLLYVSTSGSSVYVIDRATGETVTTWTGLLTAHQVAITADGTHALVSQQQGATTPVFDLATNTTNASIPVANAYFGSTDPTLRVSFLTAPFMDGGSLGVLEADGSLASIVPGVTGAYYAATDSTTHETFVTSITGNLLSKLAPQ